MVQDNANQLNVCATDHNSRWAPLTCLKESVFLPCRRRARKGT